MKLVVGMVGALMVLVVALMVLVAALMVLVVARMVLVVALMVLVVALVVLAVALVVLLVFTDITGTGALMVQSRGTGCLTLETTAALMVHGLIS